MLKKLQKLALLLSDIYYLMVDSTDLPDGLGSFSLLASVDETCLWYWYLVIFIYIILLTPIK